MSRSVDNDSRLHGVQLDGFYKRRSDVLMGEDWSARARVEAERASKPWCLPLEGRRSRLVGNEVRRMVWHGESWDDVRLRVQSLWGQEITDKEIENFLIETCG